MTRRGVPGLVLALLLFAHVATAAITVTDDRGKSITLPQAATRIVSLTPHLTELAFAAGAGGKLVGVSAYSDYPTSARQLPVIGDYSKIDLERVAQLKPDLVLAWISGNPRGDVERLDQLGFKVLALEPRKLDDIARHLLLIGELAGTGYEATRAASQYRSQIRLLESKYRARQPVTVFYEIWRQPRNRIVRRAQCVRGFIRHHAHGLHGIAAGAQSPSDFSERCTERARSALSALA